MRKLASWLAIAVAVSHTVSASEDYFTTDFQWKLDTRPGFYGFYDYSAALLGDGVVGSNVLQRYGFDVSVIDRVDFYVVDSSSSADLRRTNRYQFGFNSRAVGARIQLLQEKSDGIALTTGISYEEAFPGTVLKNGIDLMITSPTEESTHGFLLASKAVSDELRLNAGLKYGTAIVGPTRGASFNWSLGAEYQFADDWSLQGNFKQIHLEGLPANNSLALRLNYAPVPDLRLQLHGTYFSRGLESQYPVLQPLIPLDAWQRFGTKSQVMLGLNASFNFGVESESRRRQEKIEEEKDSAPVSPTQEPAPASPEAPPNSSLLPSPPTQPPATVEAPPPVASQPVEPSPPPTPPEAVVPVPAVEAPVPVASQPVEPPPPPAPEAPAPMASPPVEPPTPPAPVVPVTQPPASLPAPLPIPAVVSAKPTLKPVVRVTVKRPRLVKQQVVRRPQPSPDEDELEFGKSENLRSPAPSIAEEDE